MWNVFEQPWTLLVAAVLTFPAVMTFRALYPDKERRWQLAVPFCVAGLALGLDLLVATDLEQVRALVRSTLKAARAEDIPRLERLLASDYRDSYHRDRQQLLDHARTALARSPIAKIQVLGQSIDPIEPPDARAALSLMVGFDPNSLVAQTYRPFVFVGLEWSLSRQPGGPWLVRTIELTEVDRNPVSWGRVSGDF
ncbi:MAG: hypothetical protein KBE04_11330 [Phycisphaerae bacterium]|nr:hypothetical protein [Phycisphaerae bacterium]